MHSTYHVTPGCCVDYPESGSNVFLFRDVTSIEVSEVIYGAITSTACNKGQAAEQETDIFPLRFTAQ